MGAIGGADGCRGGWVLAVRDDETAVPRLSLCSSVQEIFQIEPQLALLAIDIPIGLPATGARACDVLARRLLKRRGCCVFPAPIRPVLAAAGYREASDLRRSVEGRGMSRQAWGIAAKVREVDDFLRSTPELWERVRESHPEVSFALMAGGDACRGMKKSPAGRLERRELLERNGLLVPARRPADSRGIRCTEDDLLDALAVLWTAGRVVHGRAVGFPQDAPRDACGLRMEIVA